MFQELRIRKGLRLARHFSRGMQLDERRDEGRYVIELNPFGFQRLEKFRAARIDETELREIEAAPLERPHLPKFSAQFIDPLIAQLAEQQQRGFLSRYDSFNL
jgi:hypothetical protein